MFIKGKFNVYACRHGFLTIIILAILSVLKKGETKNRNAKRNLIKGKRIITMNEQLTFIKLRKGLPEHIILAQVAFVLL